MRKCTRELYLAFNRVHAIGCIWMLALVSGCDNPSMSEQRAAHTSLSTPPADIAVGPVPGVGNATREVRNPYGEDVSAVQDGRRIFVAFNCSGCHGGRGGGGMAPSLRDEQWLYGQTDAQIFDSIAAGRANGMPAWGMSLPEPEIWKLVSYIQSLRTEREPDAP